MDTVMSEWTAVAHYLKDTPAQHTNQRWQGRCHSAIYCMCRSFKLHSVTMKQLCVQSIQLV